MRMQHLVVCVVFHTVLGLAANVLGTPACATCVTDDSLLLQGTDARTSSAGPQAKNIIGESLPAANLLQVAEGLLNNKGSSGQPTDVLSLLAETGVLQSLGSNDTTHLTNIDKEQLQQVKETIEGMLTDNLKKMMDEDREELNSDLADVQSCETRMTTRLGSPAEASKAVVEDTRKDNAECRQALATLTADKDLKWTTYSGLKQGIPKPVGKLAPMTYPDTLEGMELFFDQENNPYFKWLVDNAQRFNAAKGNYNQADRFLKEKQEECDGLQNKFEATYCSHVQNLTVVCNQYSADFDSRLEKFQATQSRLRESEEQRKGFAKSAHAIVCHLDAILGDSESSHSKCQDAIVNTTSFELQYPEEPSKAHCDLSAVEVAPCDSSWNCRPCEDGQAEGQEATTLAPTTQAAEVEKAENFFTVPQVSGEGVYFQLPIAELKELVGSAAGGVPPGPAVTLIKIVNLRSGKEGMSAFVTQYPPHSGPIGVQGRYNCNGDPGPYKPDCEAIKAEKDDFRVGDRVKIKGICVRQPSGKNEVHEPCVPLQSPRQ